MSKSEKADLRSRARKGTLQGFLDELGRLDAVAVAPRYVAYIEAAAGASVAPGASPEDEGAPEGSGRGKAISRNPGHQPGLFDASVATDELMSKYLSFTEWEVGGVVYDHAALRARLDVLKAAADQRRAEARAAERRENQARADRVTADTDANVLLVVWRRESGEHDVIAAE